MNISSFLELLDRPRRTRDGWVARCPAHADKTPSLSVGTGDQGQILLRCFAGCEVAAVVEALGLKLADLFDGGRAVRGPLDVRPATEIVPVAEWLRTSRGLSPAEIARMRGAETADGPAVVFLYSRADGRPIYEKFRPIGAKRFWRRPKGSATVLYGLPRLMECPDDARAIVVEGELDAHALWSVGIAAAVVSVPDGCGSRLDSHQVAPLARFREVILATDADQAGDDLAGRLARALGPERCRRAPLVTPGGKDANDALRAGWTLENFEAAFRAATSLETAKPSAFETQSERAGAIDSDNPYRVIDGHICCLRIDRNGNQVVKRLANFAARIEDDILTDDGVELRREFRISGQLGDGSKLPLARVSAAEFASLNWVPREWGVRAVISPGNGAKDHLRAAIQLLSRPQSRTIFGHTGWRKVSGTRVFLYHGGAIGADDVEVDLQPPLDRFRFPSTVEDLPGAVRWSLRFLDVGPLEVTLPLLASAYLAPVASILEPDVTVWVHGASGSMKSTICALAQAHFGAFDRKTLSGSWTSTENSIEARLFILKDVLAVVDDYAPQPDPRAQRELDKRVHRVIRNVGNHASRGRLNADLTQRPDRPPRGLLLCNGEELPPGLSINARLFPVEVEKSLLDLQAITALQQNTGRLPHAMRGYITWLAPQFGQLDQRLPSARDELRAEINAGSVHARQPEAMANLYIGLDLFLQFAESVSAIDGPAAETLRAQAMAALKSAAAKQANTLSQIHPAELFVDALSILMTQRRVAFIHRDDEPALDEPEMIGWRHGELALMLPHAAYRRVAMFTRDRGEHWGPSLRQLRKDLVARGCLVTAPDGREDAQWRVGPEGRKQRGWLLRLNHVGDPGDASDSNSGTICLQNKRRLEAGPGKAKARNSHSKTDGDSSLPPAPPGSWGAGADIDDDTGDEG